MENKKIFYIGLSIILIMAVVGVFVYLSRRTVPSESLVTNELSVNENGVSFIYPRTVIHQSHGPTVSTSHYASHSFVATSTKDTFDVSNIGIVIPVAPAPGEGVSLTEKQKDFTKETMDVPPQIEHIKINGHEAEKMVIDSSKIKGNSPEVKKNLMTYIVLPSKYPDTVITLVYTRYDGDASLDQAWNMILGSLKY